MYLRARRTGRHGGGCAAEGLAAITCQRLVRQICHLCRESVDPPAAQTLALHGISPEQAEGMRFFRGHGCASCNKVGYRGRRAIFEVMTASPELGPALAAGRPAPELEAIAVRDGMRTLRRSCLALVADGTTTFEELVRLKL